MASDSGSKVRRKLVLARETVRDLGSFDAGRAAAQSPVVPRHFWGMPLTQSASPSGATGIINQSPSSRSPISRRLIDKILDMLRRDRRFRSTTPQKLLELATDVASRCMNLSPTVSLGDAVAQEVDRYLATR
ncbi:hypothetical protein HZC07_01245 [Candidatus Micrarchaeota archaeon]|nr:hypothetical protein [Candidatus Micrarchaeota archaeon]